MNNLSFDDVNRFALTWGLGLAVILFLMAVAYALWPSNRTKFAHAASVPLEKDDANGE